MLGIGRIRRHTILFYKLSAYKELDRERESYLRNLNITMRGCTKKDNGEWRYSASTKYHCN